MPAPKFLDTPAPPYPWLDPDALADDEQFVWANRRHGFVVLGSSLLACGLLALTAASPHPIFLLLFLAAAAAAVWVYRSDDRRAAQDEFTARAVWRANLAPFTRYRVQVRPEDGHVELQLIARAPREITFGRHRAVYWDLGDIHVLRRERFRPDSPDLIERSADWTLEAERLTDEARGALAAHQPASAAEGPDSEAARLTARALNANRTVASDPRDEAPARPHITSPADRDPRRP